MRMSGGIEMDRPTIPLPLPFSVPDRTLTSSSTISSANLASPIVQLIRDQQTESEFSSASVPASTTTSSGNSTSSSPTATVRTLQTLISKLFIIHTTLDRNSKQFILPTLHQVHIFCDKLQEADASAGAGTPQVTHDSTCRHTVLKQNVLDALQQYDYPYDYNTLHVNINLDAAKQQSPLPPSSLAFSSPTTPATATTTIETSLSSSVGTDQPEIKAPTTVATKTMKGSGEEQPSASQHQHPQHHPPRRSQSQTPQEYHTAFDGLWLRVTSDETHLPVHKLSLPSLGEGHGLSIAMESSNLPVPPRRSASQQQQAFYSPSSASLIPMVPATQLPAEQHAEGSLETSTSLSLSSSPALATSTIVTSSPSAGESPASATSSLAPPSSTTTAIVPLSMAAAPAPAPQLPHRHTSASKSAPQASVTAPFPVTQQSQRSSSHHVTPSHSAKSSQQQQLREAQQQLQDITSSTLSAPFSASTSASGTAPSTTSGSGESVGKKRRVRKKLKPAKSIGEMLDRMAQFELARQQLKSKNKACRSLGYSKGTITSYARRIQAAINRGIDLQQLRQTKYRQLKKVLDQYASDRIISTEAVKQSITMSQSDDEDVDVDGDGDEDEDDEEEDEHDLDEAHELPLKDTALTLPSATSLDASQQSAVNLLANTALASATKSSHPLSHTMTSPRSSSSTRPQTKKLALSSSSSGATSTSHTDAITTTNPPAAAPGGVNINTNLTPMMSSHLLSGSLPLAFASPLTSSSLTSSSSALSLPASITTSLPSFFPSQFFTNTASPYNDNKNIMSSINNTTSLSLTSAAHQQQQQQGEMTNTAAMNILRNNPSNPSLQQYQLYQQHPQAQAALLAAQQAAQLAAFANQQRFYTSSAQLQAPSQFPSMQQFALPQLTHEQQRHLLQLHLLQQAQAQAQAHSNQSPAPFTSSQWQ